MVHKGSLDIDIIISSLSDQERNEILIGMTRCMANQLSYATHIIRELGSEKAIDNVYFLIICCSVLPDMDKSCKGVRSLRDFYARIYPDIIDLLAIVDSGKLRDRIKIC